MATRSHSTKKKATAKAAAKPAAKKPVAKPAAAKASQPKSDNKLTIEQKKDYAKMLYLQGSLTQKQIAERVGASEVSISKWANDELWENLRKTLLNSKQDSLRRLYAVLDANSKALEEKPADTRLADTISKVSASIKALETDVQIPEIVECGMRYSKWLMQSDPASAAGFVTSFDEFIRELLKKF